MYFMQCKRLFASKYKARSLFSTIHWVQLHWQVFLSLRTMPNYHWYVHYSLSLKLGVQSNFAEYLEIEKTHQYGSPDVEGS